MSCKYFNCASLISISIPKSVISIGLRAFEGSGWYNSQEYGVLYLDNWLIGYKGIKPYGDYSIAADTKGIEDGAFLDCTDLTSMTISNDVIYLGQSAFQNCNGLTSVVIGNNVSMISESAFKNCSSLSTIYYLGDKKPSNWIVTTNTYVPNKSVYSNPSSYINGADARSIKEMITFDKEFTYTGHAPTSNWTNNVEGYTAELTIPTLKSEAGSYKETIPTIFTRDSKSFTANVVYYYTIQPATLTVSAVNVSREYGDENPEFSHFYSGFVNDEDESVVTTVPTISTTAKKTSDVGTYPIKVSGGEATNYTLVYEPGTLTVKKALLTAKVNNVTKQYGTGNPTFTVLYKGLKNDETDPKWASMLKFETSATKKSDIGEYEIKATGVPTNYELPSIEAGILTITTAPLVIKPNDVTRMYFDPNPEFGYSCIGFVNDDNKQVLTKQPAIRTEATQESYVGDYEIIACEAEAKNYTISYEKGLLSVIKRTLIVTANSISKEYGEDNPIFTLDYNGFVNNERSNVITEKPTTTTIATKGSKVGEYAINVSGGSAKNYEFEYLPGVLTVTKAPLSAKVIDTTKVYGSQNPAFAIKYKGLKNEESSPAWITRPTFQTGATQNSSVGQYEVTAINGDPVNYDLGTITTGILSITPAPLIIKANDATRDYYNEDPSLSYTCSGFVNGDDESSFSSSPSFSTSANLNSNVGMYEIKVSDASCPNYSISYINGTLTITPRTLMASVGNYERAFNEEDPEFEVKYCGFVEGEDETILLGKAVAHTTATKTSDVGIYPINVTGGIAENYKFSYTSGLLTINQAEQSISWEQDLTGLKVGDQVELLASASSGLPITYIMDSNNMAEVYSAGTKTYLDCKKVGRFSIRAVQNGNKNYYSSPRTSNVADIVGINPMTGPMLTIKQADNGSVSTQVSKGYAYTFTIVPSGGWKIHSVTFNDIDVTGQLSNNLFTTSAINSDATLIVAYEEEDDNAVYSAKQSPIKILGTSFGIRVLDANTGDLIQVYETDGILNKSVQATGQITDIPLHKDKVYIIRVGGKTVKLTY